MPDEHKLILRDTIPAEIRRIWEMEQGEARRFILPYTLERHYKELEKPDVFYKSIRRNKKLIGFLILVLDPDGESVEFRRIVISEPGNGYGKQVIGMVDQICREELGRSRLWLDVFETNKRARHVYEECGYRQFGQSELRGRTLILYGKIL